MAFASSFIALNPEVDKFNYVHTINNEKDNTTKQDEAIDLKKAFLLYNTKQKEKTDIFEEKILSFFKSKDKDMSISLEVYNNGYMVLDKIYPHILEKLDAEDIYTTPYGTLIFDWEKDADNVFSLEIGAKKLGYFVEVNGEDIRQKDSFSWEEGQKILLNDLNNFLFD